MQPRQPQRVGKIMQGTFAAVIRAYMNSPAWNGLADATKRNYRRVLDLAELEGGLGGCSVQVIRPALIQAFLDSLADKPGIRSNAKTALGAVEKFAVVRDFVPYPFMTGTTAPKSKTGHKPWTDAQVILAEEKARPNLARAVTLAVHTGQRQSDLVRMCPTDIEEKWHEELGKYVRGINVRQKKTGLQLWVPFLPEFEKILATWERRPGPFLRKPDGTAYSSDRQELSCAWNYELKTNEDLKPIKDAGLVLHGLRATAVVRRRKQRLNALQISGMIGMSLQMVEHYCRLADKSDLNLATVAFLHKTDDEHQGFNTLKIER